MLHGRRQRLDVSEVCLVHRTLRQDLRNTPVRHDLIELRDLPGDIRRHVTAILEIHGAHDNHQLIDGLFINQELSLGSLVDFAADLVLDDLDVGGAEVGAVQGRGLDVSADGIFGLGGTGCRAIAKGGVILPRAGARGGGFAHGQIHTTVVHRGVPLTVGGYKRDR